MNGVLVRTGLEVWAETHNTTTDEIKILLKSEGRDPEQFLGGSLKTQELLSNGRDGALTMLLSRGRAGEIDIRADIILSVTGKQIEAASVKSSELPALLGIDVNTAKQSAEQAESVKEQSAKEQPATAKQEKKSGDAKKAESARKRTKYSINKATADEILRTKSGSPSIRAIRTFFLSLPDYKAQDIAVMPDEEVQAKFDSDYVCISSDDGALVLSRHSCDLIRDVLSNNDSYYIPKY